MSAGWALGEEKDMASPIAPLTRPSWISRLAKHDYSDLVAIGQKAVGRSRQDPDNIPMMSWLCIVLVILD